MQWNKNLYAAVNGFDRGEMTVLMLIERVPKTFELVNGVGDVIDSHVTGTDQSIVIPSLLTTMLPKHRVRLS